MPGGRAPARTCSSGRETLRLVVADRWLWPRNPLTGQFPAAYQNGPAGRCTCAGVQSARRACSYRLCASRA